MGGEMGVWSLLETRVHHDVEMVQLAVAAPRVVTGGEQKKGSFAELTAG